MKHIRFVVVMSVFVFLGVLVAVTQTGCEEAKGVGGLRVDPATHTFDVDETSVVLTVEEGTSELGLPLVWEVREPALGMIIASSGWTAVYRRSSANGVNTIVVRDQFGKEGYVSITQKSDASNYSFRLAADATTIRPNQGTTIRIEGDEATAPFSWRLVSGPGSLSGGSGSRSASYAAGSTTGVVQISVTDANGVSASISITVEASTTGGTGPGLDPDLGT